jgi:hypothetical protein
VGAAVAGSANPEVASAEDRGEVAGSSPDGAGASTSSPPGMVAMLGIGSGGAALMIIAHRALWTSRRFGVQAGVEDRFVTGDEDGA